MSSILLTRCLFWRAGLMQNLVSMELDGNSLEGTLPNGLAAMSSLKLLDLSSNYLTGTLPADWTGSPRLTLLLLGNNLLTGEGPLDVMKCLKGIFHKGQGQQVECGVPQPHSIAAGNNHLTWYCCLSSCKRQFRLCHGLCAGTLPASLALLAELVVLDVHNNTLSGSLDEFAFETVSNRQDLHSTLRYFDIGNNSFTGEITVPTLHAMKLLLALHPCISLCML